MKLTAEERLERKRARCRRYYAKHKVEICAKMKSYRETEHYQKYIKDYRARTKGRKSEYDKARRMKNWAAIREREKKYYEEHKERWIAYNKAHSEELAAYMRAYRARNKARVREWNRASDKRRKALKTLYWTEYIERLHERWDTDAVAWSEKRRRDRVRAAKRIVRSGGVYVANMRRRAPDYLTRREYKLIQSLDGLGYIQARDAIERGRGLKWER